MHVQTEAAKLVCTSLLLKNYIKAKNVRILIELSLNRYLKSTIGNISLIDRFRKKNEEAEISPEEQIFTFWMDYFVEATKSEVGDNIRFPVS